MKLSTSITKEMKQVKQLVEEYNRTCYKLDGHTLPTPVNDVLSPASTFWENSIPTKMGSLNIPYKVKKEIIQSFLLTRRSAEELELLKADMHAILTYWLKQISCISTAVAELVHDDQYSRGAICLLLKLKEESNFMLSKAVEHFKDLIEIPTSVMMNVTETDKSIYESSDSDVSYDSDSDT